MRTQVYRTIVQSAVDDGLATIFVQPERQGRGTEHIVLDESSQSVAFAFRLRIKDFVQCTSHVREPGRAPVGRQQDLVAVLGMTSVPQLNLIMRL